MVISERHICAGQNRLQIGLQSNPQNFVQETHSFVVLIELPINAGQIGKNHGLLTRVGFSLSNLKSQPVMANGFFHMTQTVLVVGQFVVKQRHVTGGITELRGDLKSFASSCGSSFGLPRFERRSRHISKESTPDLGEWFRVGDGDSFFQQSQSFLVFAHNRQCTARNPQQVGPLRYTQWCRVGQSLFGDRGSHREIIPQMRAGFRDGRVDL